MTQLERISYQEAKQWFWARTWVWSVLAMLVTVAACFIYAQDLVNAAGPRAGAAAGIAAFAVLVGVLAAYISIQMPWMRAGWRIAFIPNMIFCAVIAGLITLLVGAFVLSYLQDDVINPYPESVMTAADALMQFAAGASAFWGFVMGSWFAMRRDKYFVERL